MSADITGAIGLPGRYARALFELADENKQLDDVANDLTSIGTMIEKSIDLQRLIQSPIISREDQLSAMGALLKTANIGEMVRNFIGVITQNRRLFALSVIIKGYQTLLATHRGETYAEVITAKALTEAQMKKIAHSIKQATGKKVTVKTRVDESLLGGLVLKVGSRMIDTSLKTKLSQLRLAMKGVR